LEAEKPEANLSIVDLGSADDLTPSGNSGYSLRRRSSVLVEENRVAGSSARGASGCGGSQWSSPSSINASNGTHGINMRLPILIALTLPFSISLRSVLSSTPAFSAASSTE
jgi:hypothetical protein